VSLPEGIFRELDLLVAQRGLENRSKAIAEMISHFVLARRQACGDQVMAGMIALVYDEERGGLPQRLFELEREYCQEVVSSLQFSSKITIGWRSLSSRVPCVCSRKSRIEFSHAGV
jgi:CopG family transcriptional regulator, nickel-responsive regulator